MIHGQRDRAGRPTCAIVNVVDTGSGRQARYAIEISTQDGAGNVATIEIDGNHCEALETALRAARFEIHARGVSL